MVHIKRLNEMSDYEMFGYKPFFDNMPSMSDEQRARNVGIDKCYAILKTKTAQDILKKYGVEINKAKEDILLYIPATGERYGDYDEQIMAMQNCLHELDCETELYFETVLAGNVGITANKIIYRGIGIPSINKILKDGCKYDFESHYGMTSILNVLLNKGYNHLVEYDINHYMFKIKSSTKSSDIVFNDIKSEILEYAKDYIKRVYPSYSIELRIGKRGFDTNHKEYESFIIYHGSSTNPHNQIGGFELTQNKFGDTRCDVHYVLGGNTDYEFDINNWKDGIEELIDSFCKK